MKSLLFVVALFLVGVSISTAQSTSCDVCTDLCMAAHYITQYEGWNSTTLLGELEKICDYLGSYADECKLMIDSFGGPLAKCICAPSFDATKCCQDVGLCNTMDNPMKTHLPKTFNKFIKPGRVPRG